MEVITIYTDGACSGNPGIGSWSAILLYKEHKKILSGSFRLTTNNRMELIAVIEALKAIKNKSLPVVIYSDSQYVVKGINNHLTKWKSNNFSNIKNPDLWIELYQQLQQFNNIQIQWIKGHSYNSYNNLADNIAKQQLLTNNHSIDFNYENNINNN